MVLTDINLTGRLSPHIYKYRRLAHNGDAVYGRWKSEIGPVEYIELQCSLSQSVEI